MMPSETLLLITAISSTLAALVAVVLLIRAFATRGEKQVLDEFSRMRVEVADQNRDQRQEMTGALGQFQNIVQGNVQQLGNFQKERLETVTRELSTLTQRMNDAQMALRESMDKKLEEMRKTVDEQLQTALEKRITESFKRVSDQLENVYKGLGEMQTLAAGVGDLKRVLTNVKTRGIFGEAQLASLLEQFLTNEQYIKNAQVKDGSAERVEFAIKLPETLLPIDVKFPEEDYRRLLHATEDGSREDVDRAARQLCDTVRKFAKDISEKYINPPTTTAFAFLYLPTESLYGELLRVPDYLSKLQRDFNVTLAGPSSLAAQLYGLQMGFRSLAMQQRSNEVWQVLGAVRTEFTKYGEVVAKLQRQLDTAQNTIGELGTRANQMGRKLKNVEALPEDKSSLLLGLASEVDIEDEGDNLLVANK